MSKFVGLSAFPLTPLRDDEIDEASFSALVARLSAARVDSITALGSTGSYAYLNVRERARAVELAVEHAGETPVCAGIGALRTSDVLRNVKNAEQAGAQGLLLAPISYQTLSEQEVFELFATVTERTELPVIVYDNPGTTHFSFSLDLYARIAALPGIASIKIPGVPLEHAAAVARVREIRDVIPAGVSIGVSGDTSAVYGLAAGCEAWYSVVGGTLPEPALEITRAVQRGDIAAALFESQRLEPLWELFEEYGGSLRVVAAIAEELGLAASECLPRPLLGLGSPQRARVSGVMQRLSLR